MTKFADDFGPFGRTTWLNCAHQGPLPRVAAREAEEAVHWKRVPSELTYDRFHEVPRRLRRALGRLIGVPSDDVILADSASYGLHLLANGIPWHEGDEVIVARNDFPADILPWLGLRDRGVRVRQLEPEAHVLRADELIAALGPRTRLVCLAWVHSFSGWTIDIEALGEICRSRGVIFVVNASQALGAQSIELDGAPVDALTSVGFKWLCGPYGTGFLWLRPDLRRSLRYNQAYWLAMQTADDLGSANSDVQLSDDVGARKYDLFGTANFFNFKPWAAALEYLLGQGMDAIRSHDQMLVDRLVSGLNRDRYELISPREGAARSPLVIVSDRNVHRNAVLYEALIEEQVYVASAAATSVSPPISTTHPRTLTGH